MNLNLRKALDYKGIKWIPLLLVFPMIIVVYFSYTSIIKSLENSANKDLQNTAQKVASQIETFFKSNTENMLKEASNKSLLTYLQNQINYATNPLYVPKYPIPIQAIKSLLEAFQIKNEPFARSYALVSNRGEVLVDTDTKNTSTNESKNEYFKYVVTQKTEYIDDIRFTDTGVSYLIFAVPILDHHRNLLGVLRVKYSPSIFQTLIDSNYASIGKNSYAILYDDNFLKIADGQNPSTITLGKRIPHEELEKLKKEHRVSSSIILVEEDESKAEIPDLILNNDLNLFDSFSKLNNAKKGSFSQYSKMVVKIHKKNWYIVYLQPQKQRQQQLYQNIYTLMFVMFFALLFMTIIALFVIELFTSLQKRETELSIVQKELHNMLDKEREWNKEIQTDLILGRNIQKAIQAIPELPDELRFATHQDVAQYVSGDSYFVDWNSKAKRLTFFLQDIVGHGVQAALKASISHQIAKTIWNQPANKNRLSKYDKELQNFFDNLHQQTSDFNALAGAEFDINTATLNVYRSNYGAPFLIKPTCKIFSDSSSKDLKNLNLTLTPLAIKHKIEYQCNLDPGSILIVISDGFLYNSRAEVGLFKYLKQKISDSSFIKDMSLDKYIQAINSWFNSLNNPPLDDRSIIIFQWLPTKKDYDLSNLKTA